MLDWPPDVPRPTVEEVRAELLIEFARETWPELGTRGTFDRLIRLFCGHLCGQLCGLHATEQAEAAGYKAHASMYGHDDFVIFVVSPAGQSIRSRVLYRLIRRVRARPTVHHSPLFEPTPQEAMDRA